MKSLAVLAVYLIGSSRQAAVSSRQANNANLPPLKFNADGKFQITIFSDMHFGMYSWLPRGQKEDKKTTKVMNDILDYERPDLVVMNGDLINGDGTFAHNSTHYIDQIVKPMVDRKLTWASTYGNHDHQLNLPAKGVFEREHLWPGSRTRRMVPGLAAGVSNYYLPVYPATCDPEKDGDKCAPELLLWFFDSRGGYYHSSVEKTRTPQPNWVDASVVEWFRKTNAELKCRYRKIIPSLAFSHIPINATDAVQKHWDPRRHPGINDEVGVAMQGQGWCPEGKHDWPRCKYGGQDVPFMQALSKTKGMMGLFYGHDHGNTWCYKWNGDIAGMPVPGNGMNLCFGQHTGYGGYGDWIRGARELVISQDKLKDRVFESHMRLESGEVVGSITLNATYNHDIYPATPNQKTYL
ncbi:hypothetical protein JDV02_002062 [Purpureocillium takamizusanense]|uniref:Calcineurin-like phosphoesterase domain-containing protein n=1 Tax=Purpureocillium takamizusanense TaxID=2060973 RepID=A0A9Q8QA78_9HYPO|nr:uncharacterized protein JDV02_002062 [Purpureocillium takamizusanense]UNI15536.1 hypothetical protein JDV02_002062 [Purpureocillium takamizusanense]